MTVSPWVRLSEAVLAAAIIDFYVGHRLVPTGVSLEALPPWAEKMAFACHKLVRRFRKLWSESPQKSRSKGLQALKQLCYARKVPEKPEHFEDSPQSPQPLANAEDLEELEPACPVDWASVLVKLRESKVSDLAGCGFQRRRAS